LGVNEVYPMIPAASKALWWLAAIALVLVGVIAVLGAAAWSAGHTRVRVTETGLTIEGDPFFGRHLPWAELDGEAAEVVSIAGGSPHRPAWRTMGTGLPGYGAGWFRLASGGKALAFVTRGDKALRVPTREGWSLLVTVERPEALLEQIRTRAGAG
jgi:hypothetical protein